MWDRSSEADSARLQRIQNIQRIALCARGGETETEAMEAFSQCFCFFLFDFDEKDSSYQYISSELASMSFQCNEDTVEVGGFSALVVGLALLPFICLLAAFALLAELEFFRC